MKIHHAHMVRFTLLIICVSSLVLSGCRKKRKKTVQEEPATVEQVSQACLDARSKVKAAQENGQPKKIIELLETMLENACKPPEHDDDTRGQTTTDQESRRESEKTGASEKTTP